RVLHLLGPLAHHLWTADHHGGLLSARGDYGRLDHHSPGPSEGFRGPLTERRTVTGDMEIRRPPRMRSTAAFAFHRRFLPPSARPSTSTSISTPGATRPRFPGTRRSCTRRAGGLVAQPCPQPAEPLQTFAARSVHGDDLHPAVDGQRDHFFQEVGFL